MAASLILSLSHAFFYFTKLSPKLESSISITLIIDALSCHMPFLSIIPQKLFRNLRKNKIRMQGVGIYFNIKERDLNKDILKARNGLP